MNKVFPLIRVGLAVNFGFSVAWHRLVKERKDLWLVPILAFSVIGMFPLGYLFLRFLSLAHAILLPFHQQSAILLFSILVGQFFVLIFGVYYVIAAFYFSRDVEILLSLPVTPSQVVASKFAVILVNEYLTLGLFLVPVFVQFGRLERAGPDYWFQAVFVYLLMPVIPLAVVSLATLAMMRVVNLGKRKDLLIMLGSLFMILGVFGLQFMVGRSAGSDALESTVRMLAAPESLVSRMGAAFPPSIWAAGAIAGGASSAGLQNLLLLATASALCFFLMVAVAAKMFYAGLIGIGEVQARSRVLTLPQIAQISGSSTGPVKTIFLRELRIMNRTPIFLLNGIGTVFILPLVMLVTTRGSNSSHSSPLEILTSSNPAWVILGAAGFFTFCGALNGTASSTFSREGLTFWISKVIPIGPEKQVAAKFLHSFSIGILGIIVSTAVAVFALGLKLATCAAAAVLALAATFFLTAAGMMIDLARPLLDWTNPQKAMKQNLNVLISVFLDLGVMVFFGYLAKWLGNWGMNPGTIVITLLGILVALCGTSAWALLRFAAYRYPRIEM
jgi:ABC-2 type transport system permease protein